MNKTAAKQFRRDRADELRKLASILIGSRIVRDAGPLQQAAGECLRGDSNKHLLWKYNLHGLEFYTGSALALKHTRPKGAEVMSLELSMTLEGRCLDEGDLTDPFTQLGVDIIIRGVSGEGKNLKCAWHLDKHQSANGGGVSTFAHPEYHFQHGGKHVWELENYGFQLILEPPRLAHPPLDAILAVDFIISNYLGSTWLTLVENTTYLSLIQESQKRYWRPYALATAACWKSVLLDSPWDAKLIWPQMVIS